MDILIVFWIKLLLQSTYAETEIYIESNTVVEHISGFKTAGSYFLRCY